MWWQNITVIKCLTFTMKQWLNTFPFSLPGELWYADMNVVRTSGLHQTCTLFPVIAQIDISVDLLLSTHSWYLITHPQVWDMGCLQHKFKVWPVFCCVNMFTKIHQYDWWVISKGWVGYTWLGWAVWVWADFVIPKSALMRLHMSLNCTCLYLCE